LIKGSLITSRVGRTASPLFSKLWGWTPSRFAAASPVAGTPSSGRDAGPSASASGTRPASTCMI